MEDVVFPLLHKYVLAPEAVSVVLAPLQILPGVAPAEMTGKGVVVTVTKALAVAAKPSVTVTVYVPAHNPPGLAVVCPLFQA